MTLASYLEGSCIWSDEDLRMNIELIDSRTPFYHCGYRYMVNFLDNARESRTVFLRSVVIADVVSRVRELIAFGTHSVSVADTIEDEFEVEPNIFSVVEHRKL